MDFFHKMQPLFGSTINVVAISDLVSLTSPKSATARPPPVGFLSPPLPPPALPVARRSGEQNLLFACFAFCCCVFLLLFVGGVAFLFFAVGLFFSLFLPLLFVIWGGTLIVWVDTKTQTTTLTHTTARTQAQTQTQTQTNNTHTTHPHTKTHANTCMLLFQLSSAYNS